MIAARVRFTVGDDIGERAIAAGIFVEVVGPCVAGLVILLGVRPRLRIGPPFPLDDRLRASVFRVLVLLAVVFIALTLLVAPDLTSPFTPWGRMLGWIAGLGLPLGAAAALARSRVLSTRGTVLVVGSVAAFLAVTRLVLGTIFSLPPTAMIVPLSAAGALYAGGLYGAALLGVRTPSWFLVLAVGGPALLSSLLLTNRMAGAPLDTVEVTGLVAYDPIGRRITVRIERPAVGLAGLVEVELGNRVWRELPRNVQAVRYAGGTRVTVRVDRTALTLGYSGRRSLCREVPGTREGRCGPQLPLRSNPVVVPHPRRPLVAVVQADRLVIWDAVEDQIWDVLPDGFVRWPCFGEGASVLWRVVTDEGPFKQRILHLDQGSARPGELEIDHTYQCTGQYLTTPQVRFVRGRRRIGTPSRLEAAWLPEGLELDESVVLVDWSKDGALLGILFEGGTVRFYSEAGGLTEPIPVEPGHSFNLSPSGQTFATASDGGEGSYRYTVRSVQDGSLVSEGGSRSSEFFWSPDDTLLLVQEGRLVEIDPASGRRETLFPKPL